jgi:hypothetical protein
MALQQPHQSDLPHLVRNYIHYENLLGCYGKQASGARLLRDQYEGKIINYLRANHMENAVIQVSGATLQMSEEKSVPSLSMPRIEAYLHGYYKQKGNGLDETESILRYIRLQKTNDTQITACLKKTPLPTSIPPPPSAGPSQAPRPI